jgi:segregation and condensation protein A
MGSTMSMLDVEADRADSGLFSGAEDYAVKLPVFEGPLDLLLHLIRQNEVEISEIPIAEISVQYLQYLEVMRELDLDIASEFLLMAATLALIKSRMLLPSEEQDEDVAVEDPRAELIARLLEYERYREVAEGLGKLRLLGRDIYAAQSLGLDPVPEGEREIEVGLFELIDAFRLVLENASSGLQHELKSETISVHERMIYVTERLEASSSLEFNRIFETDSGDVPTRPLIIATFLAILELARMGALCLYQGAGEQGAPEGPIRLRRVDQAGSDSTRWREQINELV